MIVCDYNKVIRRNICYKLIISCNLETGGMLYWSFDVVGGKVVVLSLLSPVLVPTPADRRPGSLDMS